MSRLSLVCYITEIKRVEELLDRKETDRINLLSQYKELGQGGPRRSVQLRRPTDFLIWLY